MKLWVPDWLFNWQCWAQLLLVGWQIQQDSNNNNGNNCNRWDNNNCCCWNSSICFGRNLKCKWSFLCACESFPSASLVHLFINANELTHSTCLQPFYSCVLNRVQVCVCLCVCVANAAPLLAFCRTFLYKLFTELFRLHWKTFVANEEDRGTMERGQGHSGPHSWCLSQATSQRFTQFSTPISSLSHKIFYVMQRDLLLWVLKRCEVTILCSWLHG